MSLDLTREAGQTIARKLLQWSDVTILNFKPGDDTKLQLSSAHIKDINPNIIIAKIEGYPRDQDLSLKAWNARGGFDAIIQAESGHMFINGCPEGPPTKVSVLINATVTTLFSLTCSQYPVALMDLAAAHQMKESILLALLSQKSATTPQAIELSVSLYDAGISSLANQAAAFLMVSYCSHW